MRTIRSYELLLASALLACSGTAVYAETAVAARAAQVRAISDETSAMLAGLPAPDTKASNERAARLAAAGKDAIVAVCAQIRPAGAGDDNAARFLLETLSWHVLRPGAENERKLYTQALIEALGSAEDTQVKDFFLEQLGRVGKEDAVAALSKFLADKDLGSRAASSLLITGAKGASEEVRKALPAAEGRSKLALIYALGDLRVKDAAADLAPLAASDDKDLRDAALYALANMGAPEALDALNKVQGTTVPLELGRLDTWKLLYALRVAEAGQVEKGAEIARALMAERGAMERVAFQTRGLGTLTEILKKDALPDLLKATNHPNKEVRTAALRFSETLPGTDVTDKWVKQLKDVTPEAQAEILAMLARRGDKSALPALLEALKSPDSVVRVSAVMAAADLGGKQVMPDLIAVLGTEQKPEIDAVKLELSQWPGEDVLAATAESLEKNSEPGKVAALELLASRNAVAQKDAVFAQAESSSRTVRVAAFKALDTLADGEDLPRLVALLLKVEGSTERQAAQKAVAATAKRITDESQRLQPLLASYEAASTENKESLLSTLARLGGAQALEVVSKETSSTQPELRTAAIRALSEWTNGEAMPRLLEIAGTSPEENLHVLATRGYVRLLNESEQKPGEKLSLYKNVLKLARRADEKRLVLASLADVKTLASLQTVNQYLDQEEFHSDAALSAAKIALPGGRRDKGLSGPEVVTILNRALPYLQDEELKKQAEKHINAINYEIETAQPTADAEGFVPLFDGTSLAGWAGSTDGYAAQDGVLVCIPEKGGQLYTARQFDDFVLRFDFKLEPGANNGLAVRAPMGGDAAYQAMELQILDDTAPKYADLKPYQYHGSIYGVAPAKRGHLKPTGEWNEQEVTAKGGRITVKLNGEVITDADVSTIPTTGTMDGKPHPGLHRRQGHLAFLGHGSRVEFRNIRVKELANEPPAGFKALFNGKDLSGWKGLVENPIKRAALAADELAKAQEEADKKMQEHWKVVNGVLAFDGEGSHLCTTKDFGDFEMLVDWKMGPGGDSGIYLRGAPQVQIWDPAFWKIGSGGLYNNKENTSVPLELADRPLGEWNTFRIKMVGEKVTVHLNDKLVVDNVPLENYWDRKQSIFPTGQIELQSHGSPTYFRNIFIRELNETTGTESAGN